MKLIDKDALIAEIQRRAIKAGLHDGVIAETREDECYSILSLIDTLEVVNPYEQCIQYSSIEQGIKAHAEEYSFNIESELFNQLTKEQQALWRNEIEQTYISGGEMGVELAKDARYKENLKVKEADLEKEYEEFVMNDPVYNKLVNGIVGKAIAKHFFELGLKVQKVE